MRFFAILTALPLATAAIVRRGGNNGGWGGGGNGGGGGGTDCRSTVTDTVWVSE
jgi:hypothetical protein